jgi:hypothetical protein
MKKLLTLMLTVLTAVCFAQVNVQITSMPNPIDASTSNWTNGFVIKATTQKSLERCCLILTIKGPVNCGTLTPQSAPTFTLEANKPKVFSGQNAIALFGTNCVLTPGSYTLNATVYFNGKPAGTPASRQFEIRKEELANYQPPQAIAPADGTVINEADAKKPVTFHWIPVTPKPRDAVTYKLRIYEVKQGQTPTAVVKSANPMHEKDIINQTQYVLPSLSQLNADKGSSFAWTVQALGPKGNPVGGNNGMSGVMTFKIIVVDPSVGCFELDTTQYTITCSGINSNGQFIYTLSNLILKNIGTNPGRTGLHNTTQSQVLTPSGFSISGLNPSTGATIGVGNSIPISFNIVGATGLTASFIVNTTIIDPSNPNLFCDKTFGVTVDLPPCLCTDCDSVQIGYLNKGYSKVNSNTYNLTGTLDVNIPIYGVEFQVVSWEYTATPPSCTNGVNSLEQSAMLLLPSTTVNGNVPVACDVSIPGNNANAVKCVRYVTSTPVTDPPFKLTIGLPGALPGLPFNCCAISYRVCIKATVFLDAEHCNYCSYIECFEFDNH